MRRGIEDEDLTAGVFNAAYFVLEAASVRRDNDRQLAFAAVGPVSGRGLRIEVDDGRVASGVSESHSQVQGDSGLTSTAFLADECDGLHGDGLGLDMCRHA